MGLRPLVKPPDDDGANTKGLSREHTVLASRSGLVTVTGGKWTTYRAMAEDVVQKCESKGLIRVTRAGISFVCGCMEELSTREHGAGRCVVVPTSSALVARWWDVHS